MSMALGLENKGERLRNWLACFRRRCTLPSVSQLPRLSDVVVLATPNATAPVLIPLSNVRPPLASEGKDVLGTRDGHFLDFRNMKEFFIRTD